MPQIIKTTVYTIDELSEKAKAKAREGYIVDVLNNVVQWYEADFHDFENICKILGITLEAEPTRPKQPAGTSGASPCIWFSGFSSQGDGACFEGRWKHIPETCRGIRDYAPRDERLHEIAETLAAAQKQNTDELYATMTHHGMYYHEHCMRIDIQRDSSGSWWCTRNRATLCAPHATMPGTRLLTTACTGTAHTAREKPPT